MALNNPIHVNESGLPLNAIEWLEIHHRSKAPERQQMISDICLKSGDMIVDAGCGPGLWTPLLAHAIGNNGHILGVDMSPEALVTAHRRLRGKWYERMVQYKQSSVEYLPVPFGSVDIIFSANVSQYLPDPVMTFASMGRYIAPGGRLVLKDIDFGTMRFYNIDAALQARIFQARERWEQQRVDYDYAFEDSWVGSKLASYLKAAGYQEVQEKSYRIVRKFPLSKDYRCYLHGIAEWFVSEGAPLLNQEDILNWLQYFSGERECALDMDSFISEETEYVVSGVWNKSFFTSVSYFDLFQRAEVVLV